MLARRWSGKAPGGFRERLAFPSQPAITSFRQSTDAAAVAGRNESARIVLSPSSMTRSLQMHTPSTVPYGADQTVYFVVDRFGGLGSIYRETQVERTDLESIVADLLAGRFNDPVRVVAFNTLEHWSEDLSADIAREIQTRCDIAGEGLPDHLQEFVESYPARGRAVAIHR